MADQFHLSVMTPKTRVFDGVVSSLEASGHNGEFGVLPGHYAYITSVRPGSLSFDVKGDTKQYAVGHGFAQVDADRVSIVVSSCEDIASIDIAAARQLLANAESVLMEKAPGDPEYSDATVDQELALGRILAAGG